MGSTAIVVAIRKAERQVLERLREQGATSPERAVALPELRRLQRGRLDRLLDAGAIVEAEPGHYWVNEPAYADLRTERRWIVWPILAAAVLLALWMTLRASRAAP